MSFFSRLEQLSQEKDSLLCVGLDPHPQDLPAQNGMAARDFCLRLIHATQAVAVCYKPNAAFFEAFGADGWAALKEVINAVPPEIPVLLDAKRGDISSTAEAYARSIFQGLGADAVTINPYLGRDSIEPFVKDPENGIFLLCKTSNPGAGDLQDLPLGNYGLATVYEYVAHLAQEWNTHDNIGLVVGATHVEAMKRVREAAPHLWFLAPGVGAQGGDLKAALQAGLRAGGTGMLFPVSRGISRAADPEQAAHQLRDAIASAVRAGRKPGRKTPADSPITAVNFSAAHRALADALLALECVRFGEFTLKSGQISPVYIDLRRLAASPKVLDMAAAAFVDLLKGVAFDHLAALPYAAMPIGTAVSLRGGWPMIYPRKEVKVYGTKAQIEGVYQAGEIAVVIDDLITTGGSKLEGIEKLTGAGILVKDIAVLIDRQSGGSNFMEDHGFRLHSVFKLGELLGYWGASGQVPEEKIEKVRAFLRLAGD